MPCATPNACMRVFSAARTMCLCASPRLDEESRIFLSLEYPLGASERSAASKRAPPCHSFARRRMTHPAGGENFRSHPGSTEESRPPLDDGHHGLGPFFGSLPPDVLRELLLPKLDVLSRVLFARAAGACWRAMKDSGLSCRVEKGVVCCLAASGGHLECLRYVREQHCCTWDAVTCAQAAWQGHLECLRYAHEHGCPWKAVSCAWAAGQGHLECLRYARNHGCPCPEEYCHLSEMKDGSGTVHWDRLDDTRGIVLCLHCFRILIPKVRRNQTIPVTSSTASSASAAPTLRGTHPPEDDHILAT